MDTTSRQIESLRRAMELSALALRQWQDYELMEHGNKDADNEHVTAFRRQCSDILSELEDRLRIKELLFSAPTLRAMFMNPSAPSSRQAFIVRKPDRQLSEPHLYEDEWSALKTIMTEACVVDEPYDVYVISKRHPHHVSHVIRSTMCSP